MFTLADCEVIQDDLNKLAVWSKHWLLNVNATKCVVLKIRQSLNYAYTLNGEILEVAEEQKDLGNTICENVKPSTHIKYIYKDLTGLTRLPFQTASSRCQVDKEAIGLSRVQHFYHLCIVCPYQISVNSIFKHIHY